jgi:hypothetical protein
VADHLPTRDAAWALFVVDYVARAARRGQSRGMTPNEPRKLWETAVRIGLSLVPYVGGAVQVLFEDVRSHIEARAARTMQEIVEETGFERLTERLASDPEVEALFVQGLDAATRTGYEAKRRLLARLISAAVLDDTKVDDSLLYVLALRSLEAPHVRALEAMWRATQSAKDGDSGLTRTERVAAETEAIRQATSGLSWAICAALAREGLVASRGTWSAAGGRTFDAFEVTSFGIDLLEHIRKVEVVADSGDEVDRDPS